MVELTDRYGNCGLPFAVPACPGEEHVRLR